MDRVFIEETIASIGEVNASILLDSIENSSPVVSVRRNPSKISFDDFKDNFLDNIKGEISWCGDGLYLQERPNFSQDPLFHAGAYYVQEAASMAVSLLFKKAIETLEKDSFRVLDLCAAPGGKTTAISSLLDNNSILVANEVIRSRATILAENLTKWGRSNVIVTNSDVEDFKKLSNYFDLVLADVPCSGEGMFRKDKNAIEEWSPSNVALCAARQRKIIGDVWDSLKPGGFLIYSTCTFNHYENDDNVMWICSELGAEVCDIAIEGPLKTKCGYQFVPGITEGEGFFCALLRKVGEEKLSYLKPSKFNIASSQYVMPSDFIIVPKGDLLKAYPKNIASEMISIEQNLRTIRSGVAVGTVKGKDLVPEHALALSEVINHDVFPTVDLSLEEAIKYLKLESITFPNHPKGFLLLKYKGINIGFVKNICNRVNNLYPTTWRLRN